MKKLSFLVVIGTLVCLSCEERDPKPIEEVLESDRGAILRTVDILSTEAVVNSPESQIAVLIEESDDKNGALMDKVEVYARFVDNTLEGGNFTTQEILIETIDDSDFSVGPNGLPRFMLTYQYGDLLSKLNIPMTSAVCKDQIDLRLELFLTDGRSFSEDSLSSLVAGLGTFFSSSFCYTVNIAEPTIPDTFTGSYFYQTIEDGDFIDGPTFGEPKIVEVTQGPTNTVRYVNLINDFQFEFSIVCDKIYVKKLQYPGFGFWCGSNGGTVLYGPDSVSAIINPDDDSVFEIWFVEGYNGWDGGCGFGSSPYKIRLTKQ